MVASKDRPENSGQRTTYVLSSGGPVKILSNNNSITMFKPLTAQPSFNMQFILFVAMNTKKKSPAEIQRQYRQRLLQKDPEAAREKERKRWHIRHKQKVKIIDELPDGIRGMCVGTGECRSQNTKQEKKQHKQLHRHCQKMKRTAPVPSLNRRSVDDQG
jgi:hypothetical protein